MRETMTSTLFHRLLILLVSATLVVMAPGLAFAEEGADAGADADAGTWSAGYDNGFFLSSSDGLFALKIGGRMQARLSMAVFESGPADIAFSVPIARLKLDGHVASTDLTYTVQVDFGDGVASLKDALMDYTICDGWFHVRAGQFKRPFSRQQINSTAHLTFVDRASTDADFDAGRDIGVSFHNGYGDGNNFEYHVGLFNGAAGAQFTPRLVARLGYNYGGINGYVESDRTGGDFRFAVGAGAQIDFDADDKKDAAVRANVDFLMKIAGFAASGAFYMHMAQTGGDGPLGDQELQSLGLHAQASYLIADMFEVAARFEMLDPDGDDNNTMVILGGFNVYAFGDHLKWQIDAGAVSAEVAGGDATTDIVGRTQLQLVF
jgi:hypothetical protein